MTALLTRDSPRLVSLATTDQIADVLAAGYFDRWAAILGLGDEIRIGRFENGVLRELAEGLVVEADRTVEVFQVRDALQIPAPPAVPEGVSHHSPKPGTA